MLNHIVLQGRLTADPELRRTSNGIAVASFALAVDRDRKNKDTGERDGAHAWNMVKIDGDYYYLDPTWDDSSNTVQTVKNNHMDFDYFCITTEELLRTRDTDLCPVAMPTCNATRANYFYHNDWVLDTYDLKRIKEIAKAAGKNQSKAVAVKFSSQESFEEAKQRLCVDYQDGYAALKEAAKADRKIETDAYGYNYDDHIRTIMIRFKYK
jgi:hypothetical protein